MDTLVSIYYGIQVREGTRSIAFGDLPDGKIEQIERSVGFKVWCHGMAIVLIKAFTVPIRPITFQKGGVVFTGKNGIAGEQVVGVSDHPKYRGEELMALIEQSKKVINQKSKWISPESASLSK